MQFFISHTTRWWLRTRRFSEPTLRPAGATKHYKKTVFRDFSTFSCACIFFLLTISLLWLFPPLLFHQITINFLRWMERFRLTCLCTWELTVVNWDFDRRMYKTHHTPICINFICNRSHFEPLYKCNSHVTGSNMAMCPSDSATSDVRVPFSFHRVNPCIICIKQPHTVQYSIIIASKSVEPNVWQLQ